MEPVAQGRPSAGRSPGGAVLGDGLLATKLYAPHTRTNLVTRPRLIGHLNDGTRGKLTLVWAPAGFGKTTLLGEWVLSSGLPVGWLSLDEGDNDLTRFFSYLVAALRTVEAGIGEDETSRSAHPSHPPERS